MCVFCLGKNKTVTVRTTGKRRGGDKCNKATEIKGLEQFLWSLVGQLMTLASTRSEVVAVEEF